MSEPIRLHPDPSVALVGYRFTAESEGPQEFHDVALMLGEDNGGEYPTTEAGHTEVIRGGYRVVCWTCKAVLRWWDCSCADSVYRDRACKHIKASVALWARDRRA